MDLTIGQFRHKSIVTNYTFIYWLFALLFIINCRGVRLLLPVSLQYIHIQYYAVMTAFIMVSVLVDRTYHKSVYKPLFIYFFIVVSLVLIPQLLYTSIKYGQGIKDFWTNAYSFLFIVWAFPLLRVFDKDGGPDRLIRSLVRILIVGYLLILTNTFLVKYLGFSCFQFSNLETAGGRLVDLSSFLPLALLYSWNQFLMKRKKELLTCFIFIITTVSVERTRANILAILACMFIMLLFSQREKISGILLWTATIAGGGAAIAGGLFTEFMAKFSLENNGNSTLFRLRAIEFYWNGFMNNKFLGIGLMHSSDIHKYLNVPTAILGSMNYEDIGILGMLGVLGTGVIILYCIPMTAWGKTTYKLLKGKKLHHEGLLLGLFVYLLLTSPTLLYLNFQRVPMFPFYIAIFLYYQRMPGFDYTG